MKQNIMNQNIWIIGAGHFGMLALRRLSEIASKMNFVIVDPEPISIPVNQLCARKIEKVCADGIDFLKDNLVRDTDTDWIIPALPVHLAAQWLIRSVGSEKARQIPLPKNLDSMIPNSMRAKTGEDVYMSHAKFRCPDNCEEPDSFCTITRKERKPDMSEILEKINFDSFASIVIKSIQLAPGVGGYTAGALLEMRKKIMKKPGKTMLCTACRCHGVASGLKIL